ASALAFLVQTWAQRRTSANRTALVFTLEPVWAALFGFTLAGDRLGALASARSRVITAGGRPARPPAGAAPLPPRSPSRGAARPGGRPGPSRLRPRAGGGRGVDPLARGRVGRGAAAAGGAGVVVGAGGVAGGPRGPRPPLDGALDAAEALHLLERDPCAHP